MIDALQSSAIPIEDAVNLEIVGAAQSTCNSEVMNCQSRWPADR